MPATLYIREMKGGGLSAVAGLMLLVRIAKTVREDWKVSPRTSGGPQSQDDRGKFAMLSVLLYYM